MATEGNHVTEFRTRAISARLEITLLTIQHRMKQLGQRKQQTLRFGYLPSSFIFSLLLSSSPPPSPPPSLSSSSSFRHLHLDGLFFCSFFLLLVYLPDLTVMADLAPKHDKTIPFPLIDYLSFRSFSDSLSSFRNDSSSTILRYVIRQATEVLEG